MTKLWLIPRGIQDPPLPPGSEEWVNVFANLRRMCSETCAASGYGKRLDTLEATLYAEMWDAQAVRSLPECSCPHNSEANKCPVIRAHDNASAWRRKAGL